MIHTYRYFPSFTLCEFLKKSQETTTNTSKLSCRLGKHSFMRKIVTVRWRSSKLAKTCTHDRHHTRLLTFRRTTFPFLPRIKPARCILISCRLPINETSTSQWRGGFAFSSHLHRYWGCSQALLQSWRLVNQQQIKVQNTSYQSDRVSIITLQKQCLIPLAADFYNGQSKASVTFDQHSVLLDGKVCLVFPHAHNWI